MPTIHVLGGGIGGMSVAFHLGKLIAEYPGGNYKIKIYEGGEKLGGKAVSQFPPSTNGTGKWPGEHGFRFFPNFYRSITRTLREIPYTAAHIQRRRLKVEPGSSVYDTLVAPHASFVANGELNPILRPDSFKDLGKMLRKNLETFDISLLDIAKIVPAQLRFLTSCHGRQLQDYENKTLDNWKDELNLSDGSREFLNSLRALSAMRSDRGSLRTSLWTSVQLLVDFDGPHTLWDPMLPGPTDWMMLEPWTEALDALGVDIETGVRITGMSFSRADSLARCSAIQFRNRDEVVVGDDDQVVLAVPFEVARGMLSDNEPAGGWGPEIGNMLEIEQRPDNLGDGAEPMVGVQFFLSERHDIAAGHLMMVKTPWAMTGISQTQFWEEHGLDASIGELCGDTRLKTVLSVIVSAWDTPSDHAPAPKDCTKEQLVSEVLRQMNTALGDLAIPEDDVLGWHMDSFISFADKAVCTTPLWVSPAGSYGKRPGARPLRNLFLASDYVKTDADVGSMESADEAARMAVCAMGDVLDSDRPIPTRVLTAMLANKIKIWTGAEWLRKLDEIAFEKGFGHFLELAGPMRLVVRRLAEILADPGQQPTAIDFPNPMSRLLKLNVDGPSQEDRMPGRVLTFVDALPDGKPRSIEDWNAVLAAADEAAS